MAFEKIYAILIASCAILGIYSCKTTNNSGNLTALPDSRDPGVLPSVANGDAWGGNDAAKWKPEAVYANGMSDFINRMWKTQSANDVLISSPVNFEDSGVAPYGDGQTNARINFGPAWKSKSLPFRAALVRTSKSPAFVVFEFSPDLDLKQNHIEISYEKINIELDLKKTKDGWLSATWTQLPEHIRNDGARNEPDDVSAVNTTFFVRPSPGFDDWFPVTFRHPWTTIDKISATVPADKKSFGEKSNVPEPTNLADPMGFAQRKADNPIAFDRAYDMGMRKKWPRAFIPQDRAYFPACNVHGNFKKQDHPESPAPGEYDPTAVGRNWTWVADRTAGYPGSETVPFKILYTCFEERRLHSPTGNDLDCSGLSRNSEEDAGVPSGGGWHKIGDPAETLFNSLERVPLLVAAGFERPSERDGIKPPSGSYAYGLKDVAIARWLWPGEAFLTANSAKDSAGHEVKNYHWFLFHADREVCTVEWVHPKRPDDSRTPKF